jgi:hypothetical protein
MLSSLKSTLKPLALTLGAGGLIFATYEAVGFVVSVDALNRYRPKENQVEKPGAEMHDAKFTAYTGSRLVTEGDVTRLTMTKARDIAMLEGISNGKYYNEKGEEYGYTATTAKYRYFHKQLEIDAGGHFWGKDVDVVTPAITMNRLLQQVEAPGAFTGKLSGGQVKASNLFYSLRTKNWHAGPVEWTGILALQEQGGQKRTWSVKGATVESDNDMLHYIKGYATDGEVILMADKIDQNTKTKVLVAVGNVKYFGIDANMTCPKATVYQNEKRLLLEGGVNMLIKPKGGTKPEEAEIPPLTPFVPDEIKAGRPQPPEEQKATNDQLRNSENLRKYPSRVIADKVEYWYKKGSRHAIITGAPQARQDIPGAGWRMVWGKSAAWDGEADLLVVKSSGDGTKDARLKMSNGDDFKALQFEVATQENSNKWKAKEAEGVFDTDDEETTGGGTGGGGAGTTGGTPSLSGPIRH